MDKTDASAFGRETPEPRKDSEVISDDIRRIQVMTQEQFDAIDAPSDTTAYFIRG